MHNKIIVKRLPDAETQFYNELYMLIEKHPLLTVSQINGIMWQVGTEMIVVNEED